MALTKIKKLNYLQKIIIVFLLMSLVSAVLFYLICLPAIRHIQNLQTDIIGQKMEIRKKTDLKKDANQILENLEQIEPRMHLLDGIFINKNKELEFITYLESIAARHQLEQNLSLQIDKDMDSKDQKQVPISINLQGRWQDLVLYLADLERSDYYININSLELANAPSIAKDVFSVQFNMRLNAFTYWQ